jgi:hypothetical protein
MRHREPVGDPQEQFENLAICAAGRPGPVGERAAIDEFRHEVRMAVDLADLVNGQDVRVIQAGCRDRLALETLSCRRIDVAAKHLDRDRPMEPCIASAIHLSGDPSPIRASMQ